MKHKEAIRSALRRAEAREKGLCRKCFTRQPEQGYTLCPKCISTGKKLKESKSANGMCYTCGRDMFGDTHKTCMLCRRSKTERGDDNQWS